MKTLTTLRPALCAVLFSTALLTGCGTFTHTDFVPPEVSVPSSWQALKLSDQVSIDPWWQQFHDPKLNQLITQVLSTNNDLAQATLTLRRARLQAGLSEDELFPQLSSSVSTSRSQQLDGDNKLNKSYSADLSVSYEADLWGRLSATRDADRWAALASAEDRESTAQSLVATTASLYWQIGYLKQRIALADSSIQYAQQTLDLTQSQYDAGAVSQLNVLVSKRSLASQRASRIELERQLNEAQNALAILFNQPPEQRLDAIDQLPDTQLPQIAAGVPADLLVRRPDVRSALYSLRSALSSKDATLGNYLPRLTLTGSVGDSSTELRDLLSNPIGTLGAGITLPFLQWNQMKLNRQIAATDYESAIISYRDTLYKAFEDVDNAISARQHYALQGEQISQQYDAASSAEKLYESQYRAGAVGIQDWLDAQDDRRSAEESLLENRYNQLTATATLYQALGGSDVAPAPSTEVSTSPMAQRP